MRKSSKPKKATMSDVAALVGVSKTTISRYLHGDYEFMSEDTKKRIDKAVETLDYRPNRVAQSLKASRSNIIGLSIADIGNPFSSLMIKGIQKACRERNCQLLVTDANNSDTQEQENIESLLDTQVDGLIINTVGGNAGYLGDFAASTDSPPLVLLDRIHTPLISDSVTTNNQEMTTLLLDHLVEQGYTYVAFVSEDVTNISTRQARKQAAEAFIADDRGLSGTILIIDRENEKDLLEKYRQVLEAQAGAAVCFFANNDEVLRTSIECLGALDCRIGEDAGLCAFADEKWARCSGPGITCIDQNPYKMGRQAAAMLFNRLDQKQEGPPVLKEIPGQIHLYPSTRRITEK